MLVDEVLMVESSTTVAPPVIHPQKPWDERGKRILSSPPTPTSKAPLPRVASSGADAIASRSFYFPEKQTVLLSQRIPIPTKGDQLGETSLLLRCTGGEAWCSLQQNTEI